MSRRVIEAFLLPIFLSLCLSPALAAGETIKIATGSDLFALSGPHAVGTKIALLEVPGISRGESRPVVIQLWYPAERSEAPSAPYFPDSGILDTLIDEGYYFQLEDVLESWRNITIPARLDAPPTTGKAKYPVLLLSPGLGVLRQNYTRIAAELGSWGYAVVSIDHTYNGPLRTAAGKIISSGDDPDADSPDFDQMVIDRAHDLRGIISLLQGGDVPGFAAVAKTLDLSRMGALGHSMGGVVAFEACATQTLVVACINMDGAPQGTFPKTGIGKPALFLGSDPRYLDEELRAKGRDPVAWKKSGQEFRRNWQAIFDLSAGTESNYLTVHGTGHLSFSDASQVMPNTITRFGGDLADFESVSKSILFTIRQFFDAHLKEQGNFRPEDIRQETGIVY